MGINVSTMKTNVEKRAYERRSYTAEIQFSFFNRKSCFEARTLNCCPGGLGFESDFFLKPGSVVLIRVKKFHPSGPCTGHCQALRLLTLSEVKWCREISSAADTFSYGVGVKYFESDY
jgi:hypothetical protein